MWRLVITALLAVALTACGPMFESGYTGPAEGDYGHGTPDELGELLNRRNAEEVLADRDRMITDITTELTRVLPGSSWSPTSESSWSHCGEFGSTAGRYFTSAHYTSDLPVPAAKWDQASKAVIDIAAEYGYTEVQNTENPTDDQARRLVITDNHGGTLTFGSMEAANLYVRTGCYLTAEDKRKARDAAPN
ncbi:LppA family lipoprotein [Mycolicibacterium thermoresistibile]